MKRRWIMLLIFFMVICFSGMADARLSVIGTAAYDGKNYNLIYEDDQGLIWLDYTNSMVGGWDDLVKWASGLNSPGVLTYKFNPGIQVNWNGEWRLPKTVDGPRSWGNDGTTTAGYNITTSELGYLFYKSLGNLGRYDVKGKLQATWGLKNKGPFTNLRSDIDLSYWSGTDYSLYNQHAWAFSFYFGSQSNEAYKQVAKYLGLAVRPGSVAGNQGADIQVE